jgi:hypothetical protein
MNAQEPLTVPFALLKICFTSEHAESLMKGPETHNSSVAFAAQLACVSNDKDYLCEIVVAAFPSDYAGENMGDVAKIVDSAVDKYYRKTSAPQKFTIAQRVLNAIDEAGVTLFFDDEERVYLRLKTPTGGYLNFPSRSQAANRQIRKIYYSSAKAVISAHAYDEVIATLEARALDEGSEHKASLRLGGDHRMLTIDIGSPAGDVVKITKSGWTHEPGSDVRFYRSVGMKPLPVPVRETGAIEGFLRFLGFDRPNALRLLGFLIGSLSPEGPYMCLVVEGQQGSGKSFVCEIAKRILDPHRVLKGRVPKDVRDLMISAQENFILNCDNASGMSNEMSDALCSLATGGGFATRKLYFDAELQYFSFTRAFIINGIADFVRRPDLQQRAIVLRLPKPPKKRLSEKKLRRRLEKLLPGLLGALYDAVAHALKNYNKTETPQTLRMADAAQWIAAAEGGLPVEPGEILTAIEETQTELMVETVMNDPLVMALLRLTTARPFEGTVGQLFAELHEEFPDGNRHLPKLPAHLSSSLKRQETALAKVGVLVEFVAKRKIGRIVRISRSKVVAPPPGKSG